MVPMVVMVMVQIQLQQLVPIRTILLLRRLLRDNAGSTTADRVRIRKCQLSAISGHRRPGTLHHTNDVTAGRRSYHRSVTQSRRPRRLARNHVAPIRNPVTGHQRRQIALLSTRTGSGRWQYNGGSTRHSSRRRRRRRCRRRWNDVGTGARWSIGTAERCIDVLVGQPFVLGPRCRQRYRCRWVGGDGIRVRGGHTGDRLIDR